MAESRQNENDGGSNKALDYDRQFKEDMERAQALSLESLALEKFRLRKLERNNAHTTNNMTFEVSSMTRPLTTTRVDIKSRPRPGSFNTGGPRVPQIIAPPPGPPRRNSVATTVLTAPEESDLINLNSPSPTGKTESSLFQNLCDPQSAETSAVLRSHSVSIPFNPINPPVTTNRYQPLAPSVSSSSKRHAISDMESLFLPYQQRVPLPNPSFGVSASPAMLSRSWSITDTAGMPRHGLNDTGSSLKVLRVVEKRDNSNLIDLTPFDQQPEGESSMRVSVLEAFDPLLTLSTSSLQDNAVENVPSDAGKGLIRSRVDWIKQFDRALFFFIQI